MTREFVYLVIERDDDYVRAVYSTLEGAKEAANARDRIMEYEVDNPNHQKVC